MQSLEGKTKKIIQVAGPCWGNYSYAIVNRLIAKHLHEVSHDYIVEFWVNDTLNGGSITKEQLQSLDEIRSIVATEQGNPDIAFWYVWPHTNLRLMNGKLNFAYLSWEESLLLKESVSLINECLDGLVVTSNFVKKVAQRSGVVIPIEVLHHGVDHLNFQTKTNYKLNTNKKYKFLHVSSGMPRKGIDVLLQAYFDEFTDKDDVVLVIKSFPAEENIVESTLNHFRTTHQNTPEVIHILTDKLKPEEMAALYNCCDAVVLPTRGEGFGLPQAEAMLAKKPLITTDYSAYLDFCNPDNSWLLDYRLGRAESHLNEGNGVWANPFVSDLRKYMRYLTLDENKELIVKKTENAYEEVTKLTWQKAAKSLLGFIELFQKAQKLKTKTLTVFSTWNTKDGIAKYSSDLYTDIFKYTKDYSILATKEAPVFKDGGKVVRMWNQLQRIDTKIYLKHLKDVNSDIVHIQHHPGFFSLEMLGELIEKTKKDGRKVLVTYHSLEEFENYKTFPKELFEKIKLADIVYVHRDQDKKYLGILGFKNIKIVPIGNVIYTDEDKYMLRNALNIKSEHVITSHGFMFPHKGFHYVIEAVKLLKKKYPDILYLMVTSMHSTNDKAYNYFNECSEMIRNLELEDNVVIFPNFLSVEEIISLLHASDMVILPYGDTKESASAAVRYSLAANRPVVVSDNGIFDEVRECTYTLSEISKEGVYKAAVDLFSHPGKAQELVKSSKEFIEEKSWDNVSKNYLSDLMNLF
jgi:glycosyltransferase involved in cell wall biosynthesis